MTKLKILTLVFGLSVFCVILNPSEAQNIDKIRADHQTYLTGTGGATLKAADQAALTEIIEQISIRAIVLSTTHHLVITTNWLEQSVKH